MLLKKPLAACFAAVSLSLSFASPAVAAKDTPWLYENSDVPPDPDWTFGELGNGLRYAVRPNGVPPGQVSIRIRVDAGSLYERAGEEGFAHLLEHLLFRQSKYLADGTAIATWQRLGASFGSDTNAETSTTQTVYKLDLPNATAASLDVSFKLLSGMVSAPTLSQGNLAADVPIVVAVNKIDKEGADPQRIRSQLTEYGLVAEDFGGDTMFVDISAKAGTNIQALEEAVLLTADAALDLRANPNMEAQGVAIEAHLDRGRGPVATVLIQRGTLRVGDSIVAGDAYGRVRRMVDEHGEDIEEAMPSRPVQVIGFTSVPGAGDNLLVVDEDRTARQIADRRSARKRNALAARSRKRISLEDLESALKETSQLNLILKGDNSGTVEALEEALLGIAIDDEVELRVIDRGVGGITETNVNLASASDAIIIGFNVRAEGKATELANREGVEIRYYSVIYQAIDEIEKALKGMLKPIYEERDLGRAEIRAIFRSSKVGNIAGCLVQSGIMRRNAKARLLRDSVVVAENLTISSLKREKDDATEVREGFECGLTVTYADIKEGDIIETYELVEKARV